MNGRRNHAAHDGCGNRFHEIGSDTRLPQDRRKTKMCRLEKESAVLEGTIFKNSLLNSLLAGNLGGERLAPDCLLRHSV